MADQSYRQDIYLRGSQGQGQDLQQRGQEAVQSFKHFLHEKAPSSSNVVAFATILPLGGFLLGLSGLAFVGSLIGLALTTPLFVLFSPVIVPAVLTIGLVVLGFLVAGGFGITGLSAFSWIINYFRGYEMGHAAGMDMDHVSRWAHDKAGDMGHRVKEMGQGIKDRVRGE
ncbi:oleosin 16.4 kDa-like [Chenopodium quinoa]|uniref:Oleosin n=1 Tax=Chenopodium quinoa TaxID=63459 RepID=A0A803L8H8_CHEQI|nr:oleosin 16.4 kDa-like [Chenopodium quinoa]